MPAPEVVWVVSLLGPRSCFHVRHSSPSLLGSLLQQISMPELWKCRRLRFPATHVVRKLCASHAVSSLCALWGLLSPHVASAERSTPSSQATSALRSRGDGRQGPVWRTPGTPKGNRHFAAESTADCVKDPSLAILKQIRPVCATMFPGTTGGSSSAVAGTELGLRRPAL
jgi:hypothetical protein